MWRLLCFLTLVYSSGPEQVHLSYGDSDHSLKVMWLTFTRTNSSSVELCSSEASCRYVEGTMSLFLYDDQEEEGYLPIPRYMHSVALTNLKPGNVYLYRVGSRLDGTWSKKFNFKGPGNQDKDKKASNSTRFLVFGDFGTCSDLSKPTLDALRREGQSLEHDFFIHVGDIAYNLDQLNGVKGDNYMRDIEGFAAYLPYMVVVGNHENYQNYTHFKHLFDMPGNTENFYYSYNVGSVHIVVYSTETLCSQPHCKKIHDAQLQWLKSDLQLANSRRMFQPWILAFSHKPLYCSVDWEDPGEYENCIPDATERKLIYEDLMAYYQVDVLFCGHEHNYERFGPIYQERKMQSDYETAHLYVNPSAPLYVITGIAGSCKEDDVTPSSSTPDPASVFRTSELSYSRVQANFTVLKVEQVSSGSGEVLDHFYTVKARN